MELAPCDDRDKAAILAILNDAIMNTTALYDYRARTMESMDAWFAAKRLGNFPVIGAFDAGRNLLGFGTYGAFRNFPAYKYSIEHSLYVAGGVRGKGIGKALLAELIRLAGVQGYHTLIAGIDSGNPVSIGLHEKAGFALAGEIKQAGYKFGKWLDLRFYQKLLSTPSNPQDG
jgi:phosphinothricin acetyltransferase